MSIGIIYIIYIITIYNTAKINDKHKTAITYYYYYFL